MPNKRPGTSDTPTAAPTHTSRRHKQHRPVGIRVLLVHAIDAGAAEFYEALGFRPSPTDPMHLHLLLEDARRSLVSDEKRGS